MDIPPTAKLIDPTINKLLHHNSRHNVGSKENGGFQNRKDLPDAWKGVRDAELDKVSGIEGCVFVHAAGFIGGNKTFDGTLAMAQKALEL